MGNGCLSSELVWLFRHNGFLKLPLIVWYFIALVTM